MHKLLHLVKIVKEILWCPQVEVEEQDGLDQEKVKLERMCGQLQQLRLPKEDGELDWLLIIRICYF